MGHDKTTRAGKAPNTATGRKAPAATGGNETIVTGSNGTKPGIGTPTPMFIGTNPDTGEHVIIHAPDNAAAASELVKYAEATRGCEPAIRTGYVSRLRDLVMNLAKTPDIISLDSTPGASLTITMSWSRNDGYSLNMENAVDINGEPLNGDLCSVIDETAKNETLDAIEESMRNRSLTLDKPWKENAELTDEELSIKLQNMFDDPGITHVKSYYHDMDTRDHESGLDMNIVNTDLLSFLSGAGLANHIDYDFENEILQTKTNRRTPQH